MHLFLSPHFDDAVLSCGGLIVRLARSAEAVTVLTVMAGAPPQKLPASPIVHNLHARWAAGENPVTTRRAEDIDALQMLGARVVHCDVPDAIYRSGLHGALYPTEESLFGDVHRDDVTLAEAVTFPALPVNSLYLPLGVGNHVDHQLVRDWGLLLSQHYPAAELIFYTDYPYMADPGAVERTLAQFSHLRLHKEILKLNADEVEARLAAAAHYTSQISTFWESVAAMNQATRAAMIAAGEGSPAELYWRLLDSGARTEVGNAGS